MGKGNAWLGFGQQLLQTGIGTGLGLLLEGHEDRRQLRQQEKLQAMQIQGQKEMTDYNTAANYKSQMDFWKNTNYPAQVDMLKEAGLNPALLYGSGGGGGTTTGSGAVTGSVSAGDAPKGTGTAVMMGLQLANLGLIKAQTENLNADAELKRAEAANKPKEGANIEASTANLLQGITNQKAVEALTRVQTEIAQVQASVSRQTINEQMKAWENTVEKGTEEIKQLKLANLLSSEQMDDKIVLLKTEIMNGLLNSALTVAKTDETIQAIENMKAEIKQKWAMISIEKQRTEILKFSAEFQANHPGIMNVLGGAIQRIADAVGGTLPERKVK